MESWDAVDKGFKKIRRFTENVSPPAPNDEFDDHKGEILRRLDKMDAFVAGQITGEGSVSLPEAEPE